MDDDYLESVKIEESVALQNCIQRIDGLIEKDTRYLRQEGGGLPRPVERSIREHLEDEVSRLTDARRDPYFGRVDFIEDGADSEPATYYIGRIHIPVDYVYSWEAPIASLYYQDSTTTKGYVARKGFIAGTVTLKRNLTINDCRLLRVVESFRLLPPGRDSEPVTFEDPLIRRVEEPRSRKMEDIVATIQPQQYEQIAAIPEKVMIIQGVAGSGKSEVGLHRIAYLLSPHSELGLRITPERVMFVGPSRFFLRYVDRLLPGLNIRHVRQSTIQDWLVGKLSHPVKIRRRDWLFERLLTLSKSTLEDELTMTRFKTSIEMAKLLNRHIESLLKDILQKVFDVRLANKVVLKAPTLRNYIRTNRNIPLNELRRQVIRYIERQVPRMPGMAPTESNAESVEKLVDSFWPVIDFHRSYVDLMTDPRRLSEFSKGALDEVRARCFAMGASSGSYICDSADLGALAYLDRLLNRIPDSNFQHVVVDEGQDVTPLEYFLLSLDSSNQSFTILGDLAQSAIPHRGIVSWSEIARLFPKERIQLINVTVSYRSTNEITRYQNRILGKVDKRAPKAIPIGRHGEKPQFIRSRTYAEMVSAIANDIETMRRTAGLTAVLSKTERESQRLLESMKERGIAASSLDDDPDKDRGVLLCAIHQAKGLEFDSVILFNARDHVFPNDWTSNRLLYLAVTRAAKRLHIHWFGNLAEILDPKRAHDKRSSIQPVPDRTSEIQGDGVTNRASMLRGPQGQQVALSQAGEQRDLSGAKVDRGSGGHDEPEGRRLDAWPKRTGSEGLRKIPWHKRWYKKIFG